MQKSIGCLFTGLFCVFILIPVFLPAQEEENFARVAEALDGIDAEIFSWEERSLLTDYGGFGSSLLVSGKNSGAASAAASPLGGTFMLAVPLHSGFAVDTALAALEKFRSAKVNILLAFLGGEKNELPKDFGGISHKGLRDLMLLSDLPENRVLCYFDSETAPGELVLYHGIRGYVAPLEIIKPLSSLFSSFNLPWSFKIRHNSLYRLGLVEGSEALSIARAEEISAFILSGEAGSGGSGKSLVPEELADILLSYAESLEFPIFNPDSNYSIFVFPGGRFFFAGERFTITLFLIAAGMALALFLIHSVRHNTLLIFHFRLFGKYFGVLFLFLALLVFSFRLGCALYSLFSLIPSGDSSDGNYITLLFTLLLSILVFLLFSRVLDAVRFPRRESFYGFSAGFFIIFGMLQAAFIDISLIPLFLSAFLFVVLGSTLSNGIAVFLSALFSPVFAGTALLNLFEAEGGKFTGLIVYSSLAGADAWILSLEAAALSLPVFLLVRRGIILLKKSPPPRTKTKAGAKHRFIVIPVLISVLTLSILLHGLLSARELPSERRNIEEAPETEGGEILSVLLNDVVFQDSRIITVELEARGAPIRFDVSLASRNGESLLPVYSAPVPFERDDEGRRIRLSLGENPPNPLTLEIVIPLEFEGLLETAAVYNVWNPEIDPEGKPVSDDYVLRVSKSLDLGLERNYQRNSALIPSREESSS